MATDLHRRWWSAALLAGALPLPHRAWASKSRGVELVATWRETQGHYAGLLAWDGRQLQPGSRIELPTRAHGVACEPDGSVLVVARRPGDWLLRWQPATGRARWHWAPAGGVFNGHVLVDRPRGLIYATQTHADDASGELVLLDRHSLQRRTVWPTHGRDPHALLLHDGRLWLANGGITTTPETGRTKLAPEQMDSSLVALAPADGRLLGQWRLPDRRLSLRHLAANGPRLGVALQAEHDEPAQRQRAPLLAVLDGNGLATVPFPDRADAAPVGSANGGYGGDIIPWASGFAVSATRAGCLLVWRPGSGWTERLPLAEAGALAADSRSAWAAGAGGGLARDGGDEPVRWPGWSSSVHFDNHWALRVAAA